MTFQKQLEKFQETVIDGNVTNRSLNINQFLFNEP